MILFNKTADIKPKSVLPQRSTDNKIQKKAEELASQARKWVTQSELTKQIKKYGIKSLSRTVKSCESIWKFKNEIHLNTHQLFKIALFIETKLKQKIKKGHYYL